MHKNKQNIPCVMEDILLGCGKFPVPNTGEALGLIRVFIIGELVPENKPKFGKVPNMV